MYNKEAMWLGMLSDIKGVTRLIGHKIVWAGNKSSNSERHRDAIGVGVIVCEFYEISLYDLLKNRKFDVGEIVSFIRQMASTLKNVHEKGCMHMDIKLENILCK